jgi:hypothetical protein
MFRNQTVVNKPPFTDKEYRMRTTTIPAWIVDILKLELGDVITWEIKSISRKTIKLSIRKKE